jgi:ATP-dependent Clp protease ATP-binding subunit ClpC
MFEKYTEKARQTIFFGRNEAHQAGSPYIESEHLLLGFFRTDKALLSRLLRPELTEESIRKQIQAQSPIRKATTGSPDLPLSLESKRVLAYGAEEAERFSHKHIGTGHLFLGLLREQKCLGARILAERGISLSTAREEVCRTEAEGQKAAAQLLQEGSILLKFGQDMTKAATEGQLQPPVERSDEVRRVVQILCRHTTKNPVLLGELDLINRSVVEQFALRIAHGNVPAYLQDKRVVTLDLALLEIESSGPVQFRDRLRSLAKELSSFNSLLDDRRSSCLKPDCCASSSG